MPRLKTQHISLIATALLLAVLYAGASLRYEGFFSWYQFSSLLNDNATLGLAAIGMTFVILAGGIDLSVGAVVALSSILLAKMLDTWHVPIALAIPSVLLLGLLLGGTMGWLVHAFRLPSFLVTLAGMFLARGVALALTADKRIDLGENLQIRSLSDVVVADLNWPALIFLAMMAAAIAISSFTRFGRAVYAVGGSESSAMLMGLPVGRTRVGVFAFSSLCASLGGVVYVMGSQAGDASIGLMMELDAIAAVVIGGTLLSGGVGHPAGTFLGLMILGIITVIPNYQNLNSWWIKIAIGGLMLAFIVLQRLLQRSQAKEE